MLLRAEAPAVGLAREDGAVREVVGKLRASF